MEKTAYEIKLPVFEGPFDLLLYLIKENQVDIFDIPISSITDQYLEYLAAMEELDLDIASEFLVMAATLLSIKAKMLLPTPPSDAEGEEPEDARSELVRDLLEYMQFKDAAEQLHQLEMAGHRMVPRPNEQEMYVNLFSAENPLEGKTLADLEQAFMQVLKKASAKGAGVSIHREQITIQQQMDHLFKLTRNAAQGIAFSSIFQAGASRMELIVTFLALLELIRQRNVRVDQGRQFGEIYLFPGEMETYDRNAII